MIITKLVKRGNGFYKKEAKFSEPVQEGKKALRSEEMLNATVEIDGKVFNSDEDSMNRLDRVIDVANWKYNQAIAGGATNATAYDQVYVQQTVNWKTADNQWLTFPVETLCKVQEKALLNLETIWGKWG